MFAMIQSEPTTTRNTIRTPNASASTLLVLSGAGGDVQEEDEVNSHLRDRECDERDRHAGSIDQVRLRGPERGDGETDGEREADEIGRRVPRAKPRGLSSVVTGRKITHAAAQRCAAISFMCVLRSDRRS